MSNALNLTRSELNAMYPVCGLTVYSRALVLKRFSVSPLLSGRHTHLRGKLERLSARSRTNFVLTVMRSSVKYLSLLTLTYGQNYPLDGKSAKKDLNAFITGFRRQFGPVKYFWFMEFQGRGAPHFHLGLNIGPPCDADRKVMAEVWCRIAEPYTWLYSPCEPGRARKKLFDGIYTRDAVRAVHEYPSAWEAVRDEGGAIKYVVAYATKPYQKTVPENYSNVGRFWAVSRDKKPEQGVTMGATEAQVREVIAELGRDFSGWEMLPRVVFY